MPRPTKQQEEERAFYLSPNKRDVIEVGLQICALSSWLAGGSNRLALAQTSLETDDDG